MQTLEQWLYVATRGLCDSAAARVRADIGEHHASALEAAGTVDIDPLELERRVVGALGDAKVANRQYRRVLLTEGEHNLLRRLSSRSWLGKVILLASVVALVVMPFRVEISYVFVTVVIQGVLEAFPIASIRAGWVVRIFRWGVVIAFYTFWLASVSDKGLAIAIIPVAVAHAHEEYKRFVLRRKVPVKQWPRRLWA